MRGIAALFAVCISFCLAARADTVILSEGASYTGQFVGTAIHFTDQQGIQYTFPRADVQTLVFNATSDTVTLRNGKSYVGHFTGADPIGFTGAEGIQYQFPVHDVESLVFNNAGQAAPAPVHAKVIPFGTDIVVRTDETIDSKSTQTGQLYRATITENVVDVAGGVAIPNGGFGLKISGAIKKLVDRNLISGNTGGGIQFCCNTVGGGDVEVVGRRRGH